MDSNCLLGLKNQGSYKTETAVSLQQFCLKIQLDSDNFPGPFQSAQTGTCDYSPDTMATVATLRGYETLPRNDYAAVMNHLATVGPLAVSGIIKQTAEKIINTIS